VVPGVSRARGDAADLAHPSPHRLDARELATAWTTSADVESTKPEPDLVHAALDKADASSGLMIGDTGWDCQAAERAGIPAVAVMTGGFAAAELQEAGAALVFEDLGALRRSLGVLPVIGAGGAGAPGRRGAGAPGHDG
jgi:phosphoglycolate phosphatase-like HAD superfamily hydrolase